MIPFSYSYRFLRKTRQFLFRNGLLICLLLLPVIVSGQTVVWDTLVPIDMALVARNPITNKGEVIIKGTTDNSSGVYTDVNVKVYKTSVYYNDDPSPQLILEYDVALASQANAQFDASVYLDSELSNYSFIVYLKNSNPLVLDQVREIYNVVIGDVYIIEGQSNAVALKRYDSGLPDGVSKFVRTYASAERNDNLLKPAQLNWFEAVGDAPYVSSLGYIGQWGLKLGKLIQDEQIPVAIFNGAMGNSALSYFLKEGPPIKPSKEVLTKNNYNRLYYRLSITNLRDKVKAIFWSQGENDFSTSTTSYYNDFMTLRQDWLADYYNVEKIYIFQSKSGCSSTIGGQQLIEVKEAQRRLALENNVHIMQTAALVYPDLGDNLNCHFGYIDGYEEFANRMFQLVDRDFNYTNNSYTSDIEPPMITDAYMLDPTTLVVQTDAVSLSIINPPLGDFALNDAGAGTGITSINVNGNQIEFTLTQYPDFSGNPSLTYIGKGAGQNENDFVVNSLGLELVCFNLYDIRPLPSQTIWNGNVWTDNLPPSETVNAIVNGSYNAGTEGNITAQNLTVNAAMDFDNNGTQSIVLYGDLTIAGGGSITIGDTESLVMYDDNANVNGSVIKKEDSQSRSNAYDFTYWSSPVVNETIESVFYNVTSSRIFYFDQSQSSATSPAQDPNYWDIWQPASGLMIPGVGYAAEGPTGTTGVHNVEFNGKPNNGGITYTLKGNFGDGELDNDFNLVGNPYPSAIDIELFFSENASLLDDPSLDPTAYFWTHTTPISGGDTGDFVSTDYATYNITGGVAVGGGPTPTKDVGSGQGFFIRAINPGTIQFNNSMRLPDVNTQFFKSSLSKSKESLVKSDEKNRIWLNLTTEQGGYSQILIGFMNGATEDADLGFDALKFSGSSNPIGLYSVINNEKYTIQAQANGGVEKNIPLGFDTTVAPRTFRIGIDKLEGTLREAEVLLEDRLLNFVHDLKASDYVFQELNPGDYPDRFSLRINDPGYEEDAVATNEKESDFKVHNTQRGNLIIDANNVITKIRVFNLYGEIVTGEKPDRKYFELNMRKVNDGTVLLIKATFENGEVVRKKAIKF